MMGNADNIDADAKDTRDIFTIFFGQLFKQQVTRCCHDCAAIDTEDQPGWWR